MLQDSGRRRRPPLMTDWEAGQILIDCNDHLDEKCRELMSNGYPGLAEKLDLIKLHIGDLFNDFDSHEFDLPGTRNEHCNPCNSFHLRDGKWYFWDETQANEHGPFDTRKEAIEVCKRYCSAFLNSVYTGPES